MTSDSEREQQLRRLLSEAVEPVEPAPGAQTRLLARARAQAHRRKSRRPLLLRVALPVTLACAVAIFVVTVAFATHGGERSNSTASAGSAASGSADERAASQAAPARPSASAAASPPALNPQEKSPQDSSKSATTNSGSIPGAATADGGRLSLRALAVDLDGDGAQDPIAVQEGSLVATLSRDGVQRVTLPSPTGPDAGVLGVTTLSTPDGKAVTVVFVRLTQAGTAATDTIVAVVNGRLTVLRQGHDPVLLRIDPTHGYACNQRSLAISGNTTPFVVDGSALVASPELRGVVTSPAKAVGCV